MEDLANICRWVQSNNRGFHPSIEVHLRVSRAAVRTQQIGQWKENRVEANDALLLEYFCKIWV